MSDPGFPEHAWWRDPFWQDTLFGPPTTPPPHWDAGTCTDCGASARWTFRVRARHEKRWGACLPGCTLRELFERRQVLEGSVEGPQSVSHVSTSLPHLEQQTASLPREWRGE